MNSREGSKEMRLKRDCGSGDVENADVRVPVIFVEFLPSHSLVKALEVLLELDFQILPLLPVLLVSNHHLQLRIDAPKVLYCIHQPNDVLLVVGQLRTYQGVYLRQRLHVLVVLPLQSAHLEDVRLREGRCVFLVVDLKYLKIFGQVGQVHFFWGKSSCADADYACS